MRDEFDKLIEMADAAIHHCDNMNETAYKEYGLTTATLAQACATLALVKLLDSITDSTTDNALRVVSLR